MHDLGIIKDQNVSSENQIKLIDCVSYDNRNLFGNSLFVCKGANFKDEYAAAACENGAVAYVSEHKIAGLENCIEVNDIRAAIICIANIFYNNAAENLSLVGITGTKGKSSITFMLQGILDKYLASINKPNCAIVSSIDTYDGVQKFESHITTPEVFELHEHFKNAVDSGISHLVMECSSQALKYGRLDGINFDVVCYNNFGKDHISSIEHNSIQDYFESKLKVFDHAKFACVNSNMDCFDEVMAKAKQNCDVTTYGINENDNIYCTNVELCGSHSKFHVKTNNFDVDIKLGIAGDFNIENALAAIAISECLGVPEQYIVQGLDHVNVPGRMKIVTSANKNISVIVDYAHNEMSFRALFESINSEYPDSKIISIFGCPGNKAFDRRVDLPRIASEFSDNIIICEEDSGPEPFESISNDIVKNISIKNYEVIKDRDAALKHAIFDLANENTVIAFTGKGEETRLKRGNNYDPCESDLALAEKYIEQYDKSVGN